MTTSPLAVLGRAALAPGKPTPIEHDRDLGPEAGALGLGATIRTLSGQLDERPAGMERWPRLDRYGRALVRACALATEDQPRGAASDTGLYVSSLHSCLETNAAFDRGLIEKGPRLASPMLFPYTLPGAAASEAAILLGLVGPYLVFPGGATAALASLVAAVDEIVHGGAERIVIASADVLGPATLRSLAEAGALPGPEPCPEEAEGRREGSPPLAEGAAALWLGRPEPAARGPRWTIGACFGPADPDAERLAGAMREALEAAAVSPGALKQVISASATRAAFDAEQQALDHIGGEVPILKLVWRLGDCGASLGLFAVQAALEENSPALVLASNRAASIAVALAP